MLGKASYHSGMVSLPLKVQARRGDGSKSESVYDTIASALDAAAALRARGYIEVWIEDDDGRRLNEADLGA